MFKKLVVIIFFALLIRLPVQAENHFNFSAGFLLVNDYEIKHSDRDEENYLTLILQNKNTGLAFMCKIDDSFFPGAPVNLGCWMLDSLANYSP